MGERGRTESGSAKPEPDWSRIGKRSRNKGNSYERKIANAFKAAGWENARRGIGQARKNNEIADVDQVDPYWIEAKNRKGVVIKSALRQCLDANSGRKTPLLVWRDSAPDAKVKGDWVCVRLEDFLRLTGHDKLR